MPQLAAAIALLIVAYYVLLASLAAIPGALAGLSAGGVILSLSDMHWRKAQSAKFLELGLGVRLERSDGSVAWCAAPDEIDVTWPRSITLGATGVSVTAVAVFYLVLGDVLFGKPGTFMNKSLDEILYWLSAMIACGASTAGVVVLGDRRARRARASISEQIAHIVAWRMSDATELLTKIISAEEAIALELDGLGVVVDATASEAAMHHVQETLNQSPEDAHSVLQQSVINLEADLGATRTFVSDWEHVQALLEEVKDSAICCGSRTLLREIDLIYETFESGAIQTLFAERKWDDLHEVLAGARHHLKQIQAAAMASDSFQGGTRSIDGMPKTVEEAYATLNIPLTASNKAIKRAYRALASAWHFDAGSQNDEMMKRINVAYDLIRRAQQS